MLRAEWEQKMPPMRLDEAKAALIAKAHLKGTAKIASATSTIQRVLQCGYNRAAAIMDELVREGFISEADGRGERTIIRNRTEK